MKNKGEKHKKKMKKRKKYTKYTKRLRKYNENRIIEMEKCQKAIYNKFIEKTKKQRRRPFCFEE